VHRIFLLAELQKDFRWKFLLTQLVNVVPDDCYPKNNPHINHIWAALLGINMVFGLTGNLLTLLSIPYAKHRKAFGFSWDGDPTTCYILNLAILDFVACALAAPVTFVHVIYRGWPLSETVCAASVLIRFGLTAADWFALSLIAFSRCILLKWPKQGKVIFSGKSAWLIIGLSWMYITCLLGVLYEVRMSFTSVVMTFKSINLTICFRELVPMATIVALVTVQ
jgi:hypothetical protein